LRICLRAVPACVLAFVVMLGGLGCGKQPVATVNGVKISKQEFLDRLQREAGEQVLQKLVVQRLVEDAFAKSGLQVTPQEVQEEVTKAKKQAPDEAAWQDFLKKRGLDEQQVAEAVTFNLKLKKLAEKGLNPTDQDLQKEFTRYRQDFDRPATVVLSEIVVTSKAEADKVRQQLRDPKASFSALAAQYSVSAMTRGRGGRRQEEMQQQVMPEALRPVVKNLAVAAISDPIEVDSNWYIIKVDEKRAAESGNFAKLKDPIRQHYFSTHGKNPNEMIAEFAKTAKVSILDPRFQNLAQQFGPPQALPSFGGAKGGTKAPATPATGQPEAPAADQPAAPAAPATGQPAAPAAGQPGGG
jgi:foldase protein PrsA